MTRRDIRYSLSIKETMSMLLGRNPMKCQSRRDRESKIDKLSFITKYNEMSQGASERRRLARLKKTRNKLDTSRGLYNFFVFSAWTIFSLILYSVLVLEGSFVRITTDTTFSKLVLWTQQIFMQLFDYLNRIGTKFDIQMLFLIIFFACQHCWVHPRKIAAFFRIFSSLIKPVNIFNCRLLLLCQLYIHVESNLNSELVSILIQ